MIKQLFILVLSLSFAANALAGVHTTKKDINDKKSEALKWHEKKILKNQYGLRVESMKLKNNSLKWYQRKVMTNKFYAKDELTEQKSKALKWYQKNSK